MPRDIQLMKIGERRPLVATPPVPLPPPAALPASPTVSFPSPSVPVKRRLGFFFFFILFLLIAAAGYYYWINRMQPSSAHLEQIRIEAELARSHREVLRLKKEMERKSREQDELKARAQEQTPENPNLPHPRGRVTAKTNPPGATLAVVGCSSVKSPATLSDVNAGKRILWVTLDGYEPLEMEIQVDDQQTLDLGTIQLTKKMGLLNLICDLTDAEFLIQKAGSSDPADAVPVKITAAARELVPGNYDLTVKIAGKEARQHFEIFPNTTTRIGCGLKADGSIAFENGSMLTRSMAQEEADMSAPSKPDDPPSRLTQAESRLIIQARSAFSARDAEGAALRYEQVLKVKPKSILALTGLAVIRLAQKRYEESEALLRRALSVDEGDAFCLGTLGISLYSQQRYDEAVEVLHRALSRKPDSPLCQNFLGIISLRKGEMATAEQALLKAIALKPNYADAHFNLALYYSQQKPPMIELARKHYKKSRELGSPRDPQLEENLNL